MMEINNHGAHSTRACCSEIHWNSCSLHVIILLISEHQEPFVSPLFAVLIIAKADSKDIKPHRKRGDFLSPQIQHSVSLLIFSIPSLYFSFLVWGKMYIFLIRLIRFFCLLNHLLVEFDITSSLLPCRQLWKSGGTKVGSQVLHIKLTSALSSGPSSILALCQHGVQENMFFSPLILLGMP